jgi:hypothetical protein
MTHEQELEINQQFISGLEPRVRWAATEFLKAAWAKKWYFRITSGRRTLEEQKKLFAIGRTPGDTRPKVTFVIEESEHLKGLAIDIYVTGGQSYDDMANLAQNWGITRPLARIGDLGHLDLSNAVAAPEPQISPIARLAGYRRRLLIERVPTLIEKLTKLIENLSRRLKS